MTMPTEPAGKPNDPQGEPQGEPNGEPGDAGDGDPDALGDAGKRALDAMKEKWRGERDKRKDLETRIAELEAKQNPPKPEGQDDKPDLDAIRRDAEGKALKTANERILRAEIKAAAAGKLADPADALRLLDLSEFEVGSDGNVDADEIAEAINDLISKKPYLSAQGVRRFQGSADGGARQSKNMGQLTRADVERMSHAEIIKAQNEGRLNDLMGIKSK